MSLISIDMSDTEAWEENAERYGATLKEMQEVGILLALRGARGNYEDEIKALTPDQQDKWLGNKILELLAEIRPM